MERVRALQAAMREQAVDLVIVGPTANMRYLIGYRAAAMERVTVLLVTQESAAAVLPYFEANEFTQNTGLEAVFEWEDRQGPRDAISRAASYLDLPPLPVAAIDDELRFDFFMEFRHYLGDRPRRASALFAPLRILKTSDEQDRISRAGVLVSHGIDAALEQAQPLMTERELARRIQSALLDLGAESADYVLVQAGVNSAEPHHNPDETRLRVGEPVLIDIAARIDGYFADITQQVFLGEPTQEYREAYEVVAAAQNAGVHAACAGASAGDVDDAATAVIESAGLGRWNGPRTGHGIGLEVHEPPSLVSGDETSLAPGSVVTVEPGIYIPDKFGIRIEDTVIVTHAGPQRVTRGARPLLCR